jgi:predicted lipoprotein with Yx(FWY)xxD motif
MNSVKRLLAGSIMIALVAAACSSSASTPGSGVQGSTAAPAAGGSGTVMAKAIGGQTVLIAASNGMTVYQFGNDKAGSGTSACVGGCITKWPPLTVPPGTAPTAGSGVTGTLGTITRPDDGSLQVTYNGLPLYFYEGDHAAGDTNGNYPGWSLVTP